MRPSFFLYFPERFPLALCELSGAFLETISPATGKSTSASASASAAAAPTAQVHSVSTGRCIERSDARAVAHRFGIAMHSLSIDPRYASHEDVDAAAAAVAAGSAEPATLAASVLSRPAFSSSASGSGGRDLAAILAASAANAAAAQVAADAPGRVSTAGVKAVQARAKLVFFALEQTIQRYETNKNSVACSRWPFRHKLLVI
jgi:hypothetical protein